MDIEKKSNSDKLTDAKIQALLNVHTMKEIQDLGILLN